VRTAEARCRRDGTTGSACSAPPALTVSALPPAFVFFGRVCPLVLLSSFAQHMGVMSESHGLAPKVPFAPQMFGNAGREHMKLYGQWRSMADQSSQLAAAEAVAVGEFCRLSGQQQSQRGSIIAHRHHQSDACSCCVCVCRFPARHDSDALRQDRREEPPPLG